MSQVHMLYCACQVPTCPPYQPGCKTMQSVILSYSSGWHAMTQDRLLQQQILSVPLSPSLTRATRHQMACARASFFSPLALTLLTRVVSSALQGLQWSNSSQKNSSACALKTSYLLSE